MPNTGRDDRDLPHPHSAGAAPDGGLVAESDELNREGVAQAESPEMGVGSVETGAAGEAFQGFAVFGDAAIPDEEPVDESDGYGFVVDNDEAMAAVDARHDGASASEVPGGAAAEGPPAETETETETVEAGAFGFIVLDDDAAAGALADPSDVTQAYGLVLSDDLGGGSGSQDD